MRGKGTKLGEGIRDFYANLWSDLGFLRSGILHSGLLRSGFLHSPQIVSYLKVSLVNTNKTLNKI